MTAISNKGEQKRELKFRAFKDFGKFSIMLEDVSLHSTSALVGMHYEAFVEAMEKTDWKVNNDYEFENKKTGEKINHDKFGMYDGEDYYFIEGAEVLQFTGLKDKCGVEIYESDILKCHSGYKWAVSWNEDHACFQVKSDKTVAEIIDNQNMEVIGNIYQNPELLHL